MNQDANSPTAEKPPARNRLLIVDDNSSVREALRWAIEVVEDVVVVGEAADGVEALTLAVALKPNVVVLDVQLPDMDGFSVAQQLRMLTDPPAIIFLSAHADLDSRRRGAEAGGYAFVEKGEGWQVMIRLIREVVGNR
jgi:DNA-binding NarL/FixJ family response regulator